MIEKGDIDIANVCLVCRYGAARFAIMNPAPCRDMNTFQALSLAAWLVALADPSDQHFSTILEAVRNT